MLRPCCRPVVGTAADDPHLPEIAELLYDARDHERSDELFERLIAAQPGNRDLRSSYGRRSYSTTAAWSAHGRCLRGTGANAYARRGEEPGPRGRGCKYPSGFSPALRAGR